MKLSNDNKSVLAEKLTDIASKVAKKPIFVIASSDFDYVILNYYTKEAVVKGIPSKSLAYFLCDQLNTVTHRPRIANMQYYINMYSKHYHDCTFYKNTIKNTTDLFKKNIIMTRLDVSIENLKLALSNLRKSC